MAFGKGCWVTVWEVTPQPSGKSTKVRVSSSRKNNSGEYEYDFSENCYFCQGANDKSIDLKKGDRIRIEECSVQAKYLKDPYRAFYTWFVYDFEFSEPHNKKEESEKTAFDIDNDIDFNNEDDDDSLPY